MAGEKVPEKNAPGSPGDHPRRGAWKGVPDSIERRVEPGLTLILTLNADRTEAYLSLLQFPARVDLTVALASIRATVLEFFPATFDRGFLEKTLPDLVKKHAPFRSRIIARGSAPHLGTDAHLEYLVPPPSREFKTQRDGRVDFKQRDLFRSVVPREVLVIRHPPISGIPGRTVFDEPISPPRPKDIALRSGLNVLIETESGTEQAVADVAGEVVYEDRDSTLRISVSPVLVIPGHVGLETGHINFKGSVKVKGSVQSGFSIIATGNCEIEGTVERGAKITVGGDLVVRKGILGDPDTPSTEAEVRSFGCIHALFAENASLSAERDIHLGAAMNCRLAANRHLHVQKSLVGGSAVALQGVIAREIGNPAGAFTEAVCGVSPSLRARLNVVLKILEDLKTQLVEADKNLSFVAGQIQSSVESKLLALHANLQAKVERLKEQILKLELKKADVALELLAESQAGISARVFHPGVRLLLRSSPHQIGVEVLNRTFFQKLPEETVGFKPYSD